MQEDLTYKQMSIKELISAYKQKISQPLKRLFKTACDWPTFQMVLSHHAFTE